MSTFVAEPDLSTARLAKVVDSGTPVAGIGKMRALALLQQRGSPRATEILLQVATDSKELPRFRHMGIVGLYRIGGPKAREALLAAAERVDASSAADVAVALGRIGQPEDMATITRLARRTPPDAQKRAQFARALLAYRFELKRVELPLGELKANDKRISKPQPIKFESARKKDLEEANATFAREPLGVDPNLSNAKKIICGPSTYLWLLVGETPMETILRHNRVAGVLLRRNEITGTYSLSLLALVTERGDSAILSLHRAESGEVMYFGDVAPDGSWTLKAREWPGHAAVQLKGQIKDGNITVDVAKSSTVAGRALAPGALKSAPSKRA